MPLEKQKPFVEHIPKYKQKSNHINALIEVVELVSYTWWALAILKGEDDLEVNAPINEQCTIVAARIWECTNDQNQISSSKQCLFDYLWTSYMFHVVKVKVSPAVIKHVYQFMSNDWSNRLFTFTFVVTNNNLI